MQSSLQSDLITDPFLKIIDCAIHAKLKIIICLGCNTAKQPNSLKTHLVCQHGINIQNFNSHLQDIIQKFGVHSDTEILLPPPGGCPIEGI